MLTLLYESIKLINLPYTIPLGLMMLYWLTVIIGALDLDFLHFDLDHDVDLHADADVDAHVDADGHIDAGILNGLLAALGVGQMPFMILVSFFVIPFWMLGVGLNSYLKIVLGAAAVGILIGNILASLIIMKITSAPFRSFFRSLEEKVVKEKDIMGSICIVSTSTITEKMGQVEIQTSGSPYILHARATGEEVLQKGDEAVIVGYDKETGIYTVKRFQ